MPHWGLSQVSTGIRISISDIIYTTKQ